MSAQVHIFRIQASFGPEQIFSALKTVCEHPSQRDFEPDFDFDWMARKITLSASSQEGLDTCRQQFLAQAAKLGAEEGCLLAGQVQEEGGRFLQPFGAAVHDPATFGELIGQGLVDVGLRGVQVYDGAEACEVRVRANPINKRFDYRTFILEFPLPAYIEISDEGLRVATAAELPQRTRRRKKERKKK